MKKIGISQSQSSHQATHITSGTLPNPSGAEKSTLAAATKQKQSPSGVLAGLQALRLGIGKPAAQPAASPAANPAAKSMTPELGAAAVSSNLKTMRALIRADPSGLHALDGKGRTLMHLTARYSKSPEMINMLIDAGADVRAKNINGFTCLHLAARNTESPELVKALLKRCKDKSFVNEQSNQGSTALDIAGALSPFPETIQYLVSAGAKNHAQATNALADDMPEGYVFISSTTEQHNCPSDEDWVHVSGIEESNLQNSVTF